MAGAARAAGRGEAAAAASAGAPLPLTPDFDSYPIPAEILSAGPEPGGRVLRVGWSDGRQSRYHAIWLRDNAVGEENLNPETREQRSDVTGLPPDPIIAAAGVEGGVLVLRWADSERPSRFHPGWLYAHDYSNAAASEDDRIRPEPWDADALPEPPSIDGRDILTDDEGLEAWLTAICRYGIARLRDVPAEDGMAARVAERIGPLRETNFGRVFDVRVRPGPGSNAYTSAALTPHTDLPTREYQPGLQFLHCLRNAASGGEAIMVDGLRLAAAIREADPEAYRGLTAIPWPASNRAPDSDYRWRSPVIRLDSRGEVSELRVVPFLRAPLDLAFDRVEEAYRTLRVFYEWVAKPALQMRFSYRPGDLIGMDNRRLLHGREAYREGPGDGGSEPGGERWLQGCYGEREELLSRLRILARRRRESVLSGGVAAPI